MMWQGVTLNGTVARKVTLGGTVLYQKPTPRFKSSNSWYSGTTEKSTLTTINLFDNYEPTGDETESWDASEAENGSITCYVNGTQLIIAGNGYGKIIANADSSNLFSSFSGLQYINGLPLLDTSEVTDMSDLFRGDTALRNPDLSHFVTSEVTTMSRMFEGCHWISSLDLRNFDTRKVKVMYQMFCATARLRTLDISGWDNQVVNSMYQMFAWSGLVTVYATTFRKSAYYGDNMFNSTDSITGGNGTNKSKTNNSPSMQYAVVDTAIYDDDGNYVSGTQGYFTQGTVLL